MVPRCYDESIASKNLCKVRCQNMLCGSLYVCVLAFMRWMQGYKDLKMVHILNISNPFLNFFLLRDSTLHIGPVMWWIFVLSTFA